VVNASPATRSLIARSIAERERERQEKQRRTGLDAFTLRQRVLRDYDAYVRSFLTIADAHLRDHVERQLSEGALWPQPLLQLNPAYEMGHTVGELVEEGLLHPLCARIFTDERGQPFRLYAHQEQALRLYARRQPYVLTTGTGSGKSLTYLIPIVDHILKNHPERRSVRAIIIYPMNALINSQLEAIRRLLARVEGGPGEGSPLPRFARYTGQESRAEKDALINDPPHVLLTNYMMLELVLTRPEERVFVERAVADLQFLVLDELHTYSGRQGADVAMLVRRLRERSGNPHLLCIGTSATLVAGGTWEEQRRAVADVATRIFGIPVPPENVIGETLRRATVGAPDPDALRAALSSDPPTDLPLEAFIRHPVAVWIERTFGVEEEEDGHLRRRTPIPLEEGARLLAEQTGADPDRCRDYLEAMFRLGSRLRTPDGLPVFAFKLHQFISQGSTVYATLEEPSARSVTLEGQYYAPTANGTRIFYPVLFCRECGQEYYAVWWDEREGALYPRLSEEGDEAARGWRAGYLLVEDPEQPIWGREREDDLPDAWFRETRNGRSLKPEYRDACPRPLWVRPDGTVGPEGEGTPAWFLPRPFLTCLACGAVYTRREGEFRKLARLSSEGRSTATTLLSISAVAELRRQPVDPRAAKLLSFTDNRQDASLQAGHFNDFVQVALLRSAIYRALPPDGSPLDHTTIAARVVDALDLPQEAYAREAAPAGRLARLNREALEAFIEYRIYEDLRRGWRVVQPNLEQCGLLRIDYDGLEDLCRDPAAWTGHPLLQDATPAQRLFVARAFLDHLRRALVLDAECLDPEVQNRIRRQVTQALKEPWTFDEDERLREAGWAVLGDAPRGPHDLSLSARSTLGRFLRSPQAWPHLRAPLTGEEYDLLLAAWLEALRSGGYLTFNRERTGVRVRADALRWRRGDGSAPPPDPVRSRWMRFASPMTDREANAFFRDFYTRIAAELGPLEGREHTGQVARELRIQREEAFREGRLACLFCSPTMELGIDIADLNVIHLRNVPPNPAHYAQRSGRAGRSGQPALILTYCAAGSGHDQYFFRRPVQMVSGAVAPPRLDLGNEEMLRAHIHAIWLAHTGLSLGHSITEVVDTTRPDFPLKEHVQHYIHLSGPRLQACLEECRRVLRAGGEATAQYTDEWLQQVLSDAPRAFDRAFDRWREMYRAADRQLREAQAVIDRSHQTRVSREERAEAERQEREARRQKDLLCNLAEIGESDFYPYRYLASEGFLPGYNFPRLPIRAYIPSGGEGEFIARPRFLAVTEFGPGNIIYHEGNKYRVARSQLPGGDATARFVRAKLCHVCGAFHEGEEARTDLCALCGTPLDASNSDYSERFFEMTDVVTQRRERITCDEEERLREGYRVTSHFRFAPRVGGELDREEIVVPLPTAPAGVTGLRLIYGPSATLWRINHGWRRSQDVGFTLDPARGEWTRLEEEEEAGPETKRSLISGVRLLVRDTRNILLVRLEGKWDEGLLASLQAALQRGIEAVFQVDEEELASERVGSGAHRAILFWEAAEGGLGVLSRLADDPAALGRVAREALGICHFSPEGEDERPPRLLPDGRAEGCARACYDCLLTYYNQPDHPDLDRHRVRDLLQALAGSAPERKVGGRSREEQYRYLLERTDPASELERRFLEHLYRTGRRLPDYAQPHLADYPARPDFYYEAARACVFCDGAVHDRPEVAAEDRRVRAALRDLGYRVIVIRHDRDLEEQVQSHPDLFGPPTP